MKCLLIINQCTPEWASVPLVGYNFFHGISRLADVTLATHIRNRNALEKVRAGRKIVYIPESTAVQNYYRIVSRVLNRGNTNWPVAHALTYPVYAEFNHRVYREFRTEVSEGRYDIVHALTPILPRYPVKLIDACTNTPFVLGPVNGGVPFPKAFSQEARQEFAHFNPLRIFSRLIPGYARTYKNAAKVLAGSTYTLTMIQDMFHLSPSRIELFFENGIPGAFFSPEKQPRPGDSTFRLLFVGRLVPYKGADMLIEAVSLLDGDIKGHIHLTIVGDGPEKENLITLSADLGIADLVRFTGWIPQAETASYYRTSDLFCFPSIREFGGAVVLEAMASGLPSIVVNNGGIGEYVTDETGFRIDPVSRSGLISEMKERIGLLFRDRSLYDRMSKAAAKRAGTFEWGVKSKQILDIYQQAIHENLPASAPRDDLPPVLSRTGKP